MLSLNAILTPAIKTGPCKNKATVANQNNPSVIPKFGLA